jgi:hypothetical protein
MSDEKEPAAQADTKDAAKKVAKPRRETLLAATLLPKAPAPAPAPVVPIAAARPKPAPARAFDWTVPAVAAGMVAALGLGGTAGYLLNAPASPAASVARIDRLAEENLRLAGDLRSLKAGIDLLKESIDRQRGEQGTRLQQLADRVEKAAKNDLTRNDPELAQRFGGLTERLDRVEKLEKEAAPRLAQIIERLDRMEKASLAPKAVPATTGTIPPATVAEPAPEPKAAEAKQPEAKPTPPKLENWALREVYDGVAIVENRNGRIREVAPGQELPGAGRVEAIEKRGRAWIVVTSKGLITPQAW